MLRGTPFHVRTAPLCQPQNWRDWSGFVAASSYEMLPDREYYAVRNAAAMIDVSPLYKYHVSGPGAARLLGRVMTRDVEKCAVGQVLYSPWCDDDGKLLDDGTVARLAAEQFRVTSADPNLRWFEANARGLDVVIEDVSERLAALSLQGPSARAVLERATGAAFGELRYFRLATSQVGGVPLTVTRTGYTGDLGYELWCAADGAVALWDALVAAGRDYGLLPAGMLALDLARIEAGLPLIEVDYVSSRRALIDAEKSSPFELDLGWAVALDKRHFVGRRALLAERQRGPAWRFVGLTVDWDSLERLHIEAGLPISLPHVAWRGSVPLYSGEMQVGYGTSGCWSSLLKQYIVLAHVRGVWAAPGTLLDMEVTVEHVRRRARARVVKKPFFDPERKRAVTAGVPPVQRMEVA